MNIRLIGLTSYENENEDEDENENENENEDENPLNIFNPLILHSLFFQAKRE